MKVLKIILALFLVLSLTACGTLRSRSRKNTVSQVTHNQSQKKSVEEAAAKLKEMIRSLSTPTENKKERLNTLMRLEKEVIRLQGKMEIMEMRMESRQEIFEEKIKALKEMVREIKKRKK